MRKSSVPPTSRAICFRLTARGSDMSDCLRVSFRESGCTDAGGFMTVAPTIRVSDLLASRKVLVLDMPTFLGTAATSCSS